MKKFDDFDLDLRKSESKKNDFSEAGVLATQSEVLKFTKNCPKPTIGKTLKPVASCHKKAGGPVQFRC